MLTDRGCSTKNQKDFAAPKSARHRVPCHHFEIAVPPRLAAGSQCRVLALSVPRALSVLRPIQSQGEDVRLPLALTLDCQWVKVFRGVVTGGCRDSRGDRRRRGPSDRSHRCPHRGRDPRVRKPAARGPHLRRSPRIDSRSAAPVFGNQFQLRNAGWRNAQPANLSVRHNRCCRCQNG
jgi:hypothetical protein